MMLSEVTLLPQPDSPTRPTVSPSGMVKEMLSTALTIPSEVRKWVSRFSTERRSPTACNDPLQAVCEYGAQGPLSVSISRPNSGASSNRGVGGRCLAADWRLRGHGDRRRGQPRPRPERDHPDRAPA